MKFCTLNQNQSCSSLKCSIKWHKLRKVLIYKFKCCHVYPTNETLENVSEHEYATHVSANWKT